MIFNGLKIELPTTSIKTESGTLALTPSCVEGTMKIAAVSFGIFKGGVYNTNTDGKRHDGMDGTFAFSSLFFKAVIVVEYEVLGYGVTAKASVEVEYEISEKEPDCPLAFFHRNVVEMTHLWQLGTAQGICLNPAEIPLGAVVITLYPEGDNAGLKIPYFVGGSGTSALYYIYMGTEDGRNYFVNKTVHSKTVTIPVIVVPAVIETVATPEINPEHFNFHFGKEEQHPFPLLEFMYIAEFDGELASDIHAFCNEFELQERGTFSHKEFSRWQQLSNRLHWLNEKVNEPRSEDDLAF